MKETLKHLEKARLEQPRERIEGDDTKRDEEIEGPTWEEEIRDIHTTLERAGVVHSGNE